MYIIFDRVIGDIDMLIGFTFSNFMSFYGENTFSMKTGKDTQFSELNTTKTKYGELLKSAFVYGANGSGKTNFIKAIDYMKAVVLSELTTQSKNIANIDNFAFSKKSEEVPSLFEIVIIVNGTQYEYGFELLAGEVNKEYLYRKNSRKTLVFTRTSPDYNDITIISKDMSNVKNLVKNTRRDNLFLYWANGGNNEIAMSIYNWFDNINIFDAQDTSYLLNATVDYIEGTSDGTNNVLSLIQSAGVGINDLEIEITVNEDELEFIQKAVKKRYLESFSPGRAVSVMAKHDLYDEAWERIGAVSLPVQLESAGTKKLFEISGPILSTLENGGVVFIDEIDARLHPMLVRHLVMMFNSISQNPNNAQLICNTHDVLLLDEDIRRDQVYFTEKDEYGVSTLYSLNDFNGVRKDSKILKQYLLGVYGATPKLEDFEVPVVNEAIHAYREVVVSPQFRELERLRADAKSREASALADAEQRGESRERAKWEEVVADKDAAIADKDAAFADKDAAIADKDAALADKDAEIEKLRAQLDNQRE